MIRKIGFPAGLGFFFNTMYNVVDTWFGGRISVTALAAMSLSFPVFFILISVGSGFATGITALIGNALGEKNGVKAHELTVQSLIFGFILTAFITALGLLLSPALFRVLGAREDYLKVALSYINIIFIGSVFFIFSNFLNAVLTATGNTKPYRNALIAGFFLNIGLEPWFIYGGLGVPAMGLRGVAVATVLIQAAGCVYLFFAVRKTGLLSPPDRIEGSADPSIRTGHMKDLLTQGLPASTNYLTIAAGIFVITYFISRFGQEAVAAYGAAVRIEQIVLLPTIGLNTAVLSLTAQNAGARHYPRVWETRKRALISGGFFMGAGLLLVFFFGRFILKFFTKDAAVLDAGTAYLRIDAFVLYAYVILFSHVGILQGLKRPMFPVIIGIYRQIAAPIGIFLLLTRVFGIGLSGIWWGILIVTWSAAIISFFYARGVLIKVSGIHEGR